jgi:hypothetical protein
VFLTSMVSSLFMPPALTAAVAAFFRMRFDARQCSIPEQRCNALSYTERQTCSAGSWVDC